MNVFESLHGDCIYRKKTATTITTNEKSEDKMKYNDATVSVVHAPNVHKNSFDNVNCAH